MWITLAPEKMTPPTADGRHQPPSTYRIEMGLTSYGLRDIGDVTRIRKSLPPHNDGKSSKLIKDESFLLLDWEGYSITSADELYHTVWENKEGTYEVKSPVTGSLREVRRIGPVSQEGLDETDVLAVVISSRSELEDVAKKWIDEKEYYQIIKDNDMVRSKSGGIFKGPETGLSG